MEYHLHTITVGVRTSRSRHARRMTERNTFTGQFSSDYEMTNWNRSKASLANDRIVWQDKQSFVQKAADDQARENFIREMLTSTHASLHEWTTLKSDWTAFSPSMHVLFRRVACRGHGILGNFSAIRDVLLIDVFFVSLVFLVLFNILQWTRHALVSRIGTKSFGHYQLTDVRLLYTSTK